MSETLLNDERSIVKEFISMGDNKALIREIILFLILMGLTYISTLFYGGLSNTGQMLRLIFISIFIIFAFRNLLLNGWIIEFFKKNLILFVWIILFFGYLIFQFFFISVYKQSSAESFFHLLFAAVFFLSLLSMNWENFRFRYFKGLMFWGFFQAVLVIIQRIFGFIQKSDVFLSPLSFILSIQEALGIAGSAGTFFNPNFM